MASDVRSRRPVGAAGARLLLADVLEDAGRQTTAALDRCWVRGAVCSRVDLADPSSITRLASDDVGAHEGTYRTGWSTTPPSPPASAGRCSTRSRWLDLGSRHAGQCPRYVAGDAGRWRRFWWGPAVAASSDVASDTALWGAPRLLAYVASKGAVMAMTRSLRPRTGSPRVSASPPWRPGSCATRQRSMCRRSATASTKTGRAVPGGAGS